MQVEAGGGDIDSQGGDVLGRAEVEGLTCLAELVEDLDLLVVQYGLEQGELVDLAVEVLEHATWVLDAQGQGRLGGGGHGHGDGCKLDAVEVESRSACGVGPDEMVPTIGGGGGGGNRVRAHGVLEEVACALGETELVGTEPIAEGDDAGIVDEAIHLDPDRDSKLARRGKLAEALTGQGRGRGAGEVEGLADLAGDAVGAVVAEDEGAAKDVAGNLRG